MRVQEVVSGELVAVQGVGVPAGTELHVTSRQGAFKVEEDPFTGVLTITKLWGTITLDLNP